MKSSFFISLNDEVPRMKKLIGRHFPLKDILARVEIKFSLFFSTLVGLPFFFTRPWADDVFMLYLPEYHAGNSPLRLVHMVIKEIPGYIAMGVFRPMSRLIFYVENWIVLRFSVFNGIPPHVVKAGVRFFILLLLLIAISSFVRQALKQVPLPEAKRDLFLKYFQVIFPIVFSSFLTLRFAGQSPLVLFPSLYLLSACVVFFTPYGVTRFTQTQVGVPRVLQLIAFGIGGMCISSMIEITHIAVPMALSYTMLIWILSSDRSDLTFKKMVQNRAIQNSLVLFIGFLSVFIPVRIAIHSACSQNECYKAASINVDSDVYKITAIRTIAPLLAYEDSFQRATSGRSKYNQSEEISIFILILLVYFTMFQYMIKSEKLLVHSKVSAKYYFSVIGPTLIALLCASAIAGLSSKFQTSAILIGSWRDTAVTWPALSVLVTFIIVGIISKIQTRPLLIIVLVLLGMAPIPTLITNYETIAAINRSDDARIHLSLANNLVYFDKSEDGIAARCKIIDELRNVVRDDDERSVVDEIEKYMNKAAHNFYRQPYCHD